MQDAELIVVLNVSKGHSSQAPLLFTFRKYPVGQTTNQKQPGKRFPTEIK